MVREYEDKITSARFVMHVNSDQLKGAGLRKPTAPINTFVYNKGSKQKVKLMKLTMKCPKGLYYH
jgi:hypothetical protein